MSAKQPKPKKAKEVKRPDGARAFRLEGSNRVEWLHPLRAKARNLSRSDNRKWKEDREVIADEVRESPLPISGEERRRLHAEGIRKDAERLVAQQAHRAKETAMSTDTKIEKRSSSSKSSDGGARARQDWKGVPMTALLRLCGKKGFSKGKTEEVMKKMGLHPRPGTMQIQMKWGRSGFKELPTLDRDQKDAFNKIADGIADEEPKKKDKKKEKSGSNGKAGKSEKKVAKREGGEKKEKKDRPKLEVRASSTEEKVEKKHEPAA